MARVAMVLGDEFEDSEFRVPYDRLREAGHDVTLVGEYVDKTLTGRQREQHATIEMAARDAHPHTFDAMVIPGGYSPDHLRIKPEVVGFVRDFVATGKPIAAVCHGPQLLIEAHAVAGRTMTSWPSVRTDLQNAGARWVDAPVIEDQQFITSRGPDDLDSLSSRLIERLGVRTSEWDSSKD